MWPSGTLVGAGNVGRPTLTLTISANADNINLKTLIEAVYGPVSSAADVFVTINAAVKIGSTSSGTPALRSGGFPATSYVKVTNNGRVAGCGGDAGDGGDRVGAGTYNNGHNGQDGGDAVSLDENVDWDNTTTGQVFGGGGGGAGGGAGQKVNFGSAAPGSGGGGGQGDDGGAKGFKGSGAGSGTANDGTAGSESGNGSGGAASPDGGGKGGRGGSWGSSGGNGGDGGPAHGANGGNGGSGGRAVKLNGHSINWLAGNNTTQVKGAVS